MGIEVVAGTRLLVVDRERVAGAEDVETRRRVVGAGLPDSAAAGFPGVVVVFPGFASRVAGLGHDVPAPELLAGPHFEPGHPAARSAVARAVLHDHLAVAAQRRGHTSLDSAEFVLAGDLLLSHDLA